VIPDNEDYEGKYRTSHDDSLNQKRIAPIHAFDEKSYAGIACKGPSATEKHEREGQTSLSLEPIPQNGGEGHRTYETQPTSGQGSKSNIEMPGLASPPR
jgi:hypothetical protein